MVRMSTFPVDTVRIGYPDIDALQHRTLIAQKLEYLSADYRTLSNYVASFLIGLAERICQTKPIMPLELKFEMRNV